jgi:HAD superfamily hydrolase (TIGR01509 family)
MDGIVFDMDGVLFDSERLYNRAWREVGARLELHDMDGTIRSCVGRNGSDIREFLQEKYGPDFEAAQFARDVTAVFQTIVDTEGLPIKPGVPELLGWLRAQGGLIALATSSGKNSTAHSLEAAGLAQYFDAIVTGDMITKGKPAPDIYLLACEKLGEKPGSCYAVEDSPNGVRSAHAAGLKTILVPDIAEIPADIEKLAYRKFDSLFEFKEYLETL